MAETKRPNILYVFSDQHRAEATGCYGNKEIQTPAFDALAAQGVRFATAISNTPVCGPYRASLMSGRYVHNVNYLTNYVPFRPQGPCIAEVFKAAGYATGYIGKWHLYWPDEKGKGDEAERMRGFVPPHARFGFDDYWAAFNGGHRYHAWEYYRGADPTPIHVERYQPEEQVDQAIEFIEGYRGAKPWCLFLSWGPPHTPFDPPPGYAERYADVSLPPNVPLGRPQEYAREVIPRYYGLIHSLDVAFGRLMQALDRMQLAEDTIVVYTSDHGEMLGSHGYRGNKRWPHDASIRVPFIIRWPGRIPAGQVLRRPLSTPDIFPTLVELAGLSVPEGLDGISASRAILEGDESHRDEFAYCTMPYGYVPWPGWRALRSERYLYARTQSAPWLLFDLAADPWETRNLIGDPAYATLAQEMEERLQRRMTELNDSWEVSLDSGDVDAWVPGSKKLVNNDLGVPWPLE